MQRLFRARVLAPLVSLIALTLLYAQEQNDPYAGKIAKASPEASQGLKRMQLPAGLRASLFAAEPLLANPVAFCIDEKGRFYVAETFRLHKGVTDNRQHMSWLDDELASRTVADRLAMYQKHLGKKFASYAIDQDRVRRLEDTDGDGQADKAVIFAGGFKNPEDGLGSGVLARGNTVWYTNIPHLWMLQDIKGTGRADVKKSLHYGYGVHVAFIGHDLHGLRFGPDGKLYFTVGDRGAHIETEGRVVSMPDTGSVFRCNPDGSELEIFATGLRNPQELAFDQYGNLFTGDNNADGGDQARWVHLVEGGDSGWRIGYQYLKGLGRWNAEKLWHTAATNTGSYLLPPLAHIGNGPSGLTYHPGVSLLPEKYKEHFFLCDFRGGSGNSGIHAFALKPKGATFEVINRQQFAWSVLATDCDFGPDGGFYVSDWVDGWGLPFKGRLYKIFDPARLKDPVVADVKKLLAEGMSKRSNAELAKLLEHADMRVRQEAQFTLAEKGAAAVLVEAARSGTQLARLHAIWALGQIGRKKADVLSPLIEILKDKDAEVRAQAAKVLGEGRVKAAREPLQILLKDEAPRVRFCAAQALGKLGQAEAIPAILNMLRANADGDLYVRHAGVMALAWIGDRKATLDAAKDTSPAVRLGALLAMRRLHMPEVAGFLDDADPRLVLEAARAIYDEPIPEALPQLAAMMQRPAGAFKSIPKESLEPVVLRGINAHYRLGGSDHALALASFAGRSGTSDSLRVEALKMLGDWAAPSGRDRVVGLWRPLKPRPASEAAEAIRAALAGIMIGPDAVRGEGARVAAKLGIKEVGPLLREIVADKQRNVAVRIESLKALEVLKDDGLQATAELALRDDEPRLRHQARAWLLPRADLQEAVKQLTVVAAKGDMVERQGAFAILANLQAAPADGVIAGWLDRLLRGQAPPEVHLDILEAARKRATPELKKLLAQYEAARPKTDSLAAYTEALHGGDGDAGQRIFFDKAEVSCLRCHKISGAGGEVGPDLTGIGKREKRAYLLESLVHPDKNIAKGFDTVVLTLTNGQFKVGIIKAETPKEVRLMTADGELLTIPMSQIEDRARGKSAMPEDILKHLSPRELRDLVAFLASLK